MELKWLEDFLALVEHGSFTRAADARFVSQPAFSRRIRALEDWLGVDLIDRNAYPTRLSTMGKEFTPAIRELVEQTHNLRSDIRDKEALGNRLVVSTQHSLSVTVCPQWFGTIRHLLQGNSIRLKARNLHDCVDHFLAGQSDILLCYFSPDVFPELERSDLKRLTLGTEPLIPVATPALAQRTKGKPLPLVGFPSDSFFGGLIQSECLPVCHERGVEFELVFETALSESARALALQNAGVTWLPASLVRSDLEEGRLIRLAELAGMEMTVVMIVSEMNSKPVLKEIWSYTAENLAAAGTEDGAGHAGIVSVQS